MLPYAVHSKEKSFDPFITISYCTGIYFSKKANIPTDQENVKAIQITTDFLIERDFKWQLLEEIFCTLIRIKFVIDFHICLLAHKFGAHTVHILY